MNNLTTLAQLREMNAGEAAALPVDHLAMLLEEVAEMRADAKRLTDLLNDALHSRFGAVAGEIRRQAGKQTGRARVAVDGFEIVADLALKIDWDEDGLKTVEARLLGMGENPDEYIKTKRTVSEAAYQRWPSSLQSLFLPHRTVGTGKPTYSIEKKEAA